MSRSIETFLRVVNETTSQELIMTKVIEPWMEEAACYFLFRKEGRYSSVEEIKELAQDIADCMPPPDKGENME